MHRQPRNLVLSVLLASLFVSSLHAEDRRGGPPFRKRPPRLTDDAFTGSHRRLANGIEDLLRPEEALEQRLSHLRNLRNLKALDKQFHSDLGDLAKKLLKNKELRQSLQKMMSPEDVERLKKQVQQGDFTTQDPALRKLMEQGKSLAKLEPAEKETLQQFQQKLTNRATTGQTGVGPEKYGDSNAKGPVTTPLSDSGQPPTTGITPWQQDTARAADWLKRGLDGFVKNMDQWVTTPAGKSWSDALKGLARRAEANQASATQLGERASGLAKWMGKITGANTPRLPRLGNPRLPNLPRFGSMPSVGVPRASSLAAPVQVVLAFACAGLFALLLWRGRDWFSALRSLGTTRWRLGPWPIQPDQVSTRGDLVRAFEYLALLCLGPMARTCHHLELGQRIGQQPALDIERRRESADHLAHLYEQARYTPDEEVLPGEDLRRARRELAYLAGIAAV